MANEKHLAILKQGVEVWNKWREDNPKVDPDLSRANLGNDDSIDMNLNGMNLSKTDLSAADLRTMNLEWSNLIDADLRGVDLSDSYLSGASFEGADLRWAILHRVTLNRTDFRNTLFGQTFFTDVDLSVAKNLSLARHKFQSIIGIDTLYLSKGNIPHEFLKGCGVPETMIEFAKSLVGQAIEYYSCFISHSFKDEDFAQALNARMKAKGLSVYYAPEEMKGGQKIYEQLYEAIRHHDKLILVLSEASMNSNWVQTEIRRARKHEREDKRRKLFPISLVPFGEIQKWELFDSDEGRDLAQEIREYYIPDFSQWKIYDSFNQEFEKLLRDLRAGD